jgi:hypothetical protein
MRAEGAGGTFLVDTSEPAALEVSHRPVRIEEAASQKIVSNLLTAEGEIVASIVDETIRTFIEVSIPLT